MLRQHRPPTGTSVAEEPWWRLCEQRKALQILYMLFAIVYNDDRTYYGKCQQSTIVLYTQQNSDQESDQELKASEIQKSISCDCEISEPLIARVREHLLGCKTPRQLI